MSTPLRDAEPAGDERAPRSHESALLVVDDRPDNLYVIESLLAQHMPDCVVLKASSAEQGLDLARRHVLDGALIDVQMPGMDGITMCRRLKGDRRTARIPIVLVTAQRATPKLKAEGLDAGADDFLLKPIENVELIAKIGVMRRIKRTEDELRVLNRRLRDKVSNRTEELLRTHSDLDQILGAVPPIWVIGLDHSVVRANAAFGAALSTPEVELVGRRCHDVLKGPRCRGPECALTQVLGGADHCESEVEVPLPDGTVATFLASARPYRGPSGDVIGVVERLTDITEYRALEERLRQSQKMEAIGTLAAGVAHDFNNLLAVILGYSDPALGVDDDAARRERLSHIHGAAERATILTGQLLAFGRKQVLRPAVIDLGDVLIDLEPMMRRLIREDVELKVALGRTVGCVCADRTQVEQAILNLVVNARDAMPKGGTLSMRTGGTTLPSPEARGLPADVAPGSYSWLSVTDTGTGIDRDTLARVFEPFFTTKKPGQGTGLGLATAHGIVLQSEGHIAVESDVGSGTCFTIYLPVVSEAAPVGTEQSSLADAPTGTETVLVVEDDEAVRAYVQDIVLELGYTVLVAADGEAALDVVEVNEGSIDVVVTDVIMPRMSGYELVRALSVRYPDLRFICVSGYAFGEGDFDSLTESRVRYIAKPFRRRALARTLRESIEGRAAS